MAGSDSNRRRRTASNANGNADDDAAQSQQRSQPPPAEPAPSPVDASGVVAYIDKSGLYDMQQVKRLLDDQLISFMEAQGYDESTFAANIKLVAGTIAVIAAVYSHFGVKEFPESRSVVLACVLLYLSCTVVITVTSLVLEASAIFVGSLVPRARRITGRQHLPPTVWVHTSIGGAGSSIFRVHIRTSTSSASKQRVAADEPEQEFPYERFFTTEGNFLHDAFRSEMDSILQRASSEDKKTQ